MQNKHSSLFCKNNYDRNKIQNFTTKTATVNVIKLFYLSLSSVKNKLESLSNSLVSYVSGNIDKSKSRLKRHWTNTLAYFVKASFTKIKLKLYDFVYGFQFYKFSCLVDERGQNKLEWLSHASLTLHSDCYSQTLDETVEGFQ
jgi:hypothetical protein